MFYPKVAGDNREPPLSSPGRYFSAERFRAACTEAKIFSCSRRSYDAITPNAFPFPKITFAGSAMFTSRSTTFSALVAFGLLTPSAQAQPGAHPPIQVSQHPHYGCLGYCPGPLNPHQNYYGCLGYCPGPLFPQRPDYYGCLGYCPGPLIPSRYPYPTWGLYPLIGPNAPAPEAQPKPTKKVGDWVVDLHSTNARTRGQAAAALGRYGPAAKEAVPALIGVLKDKDPFVRVQATDTLAKIGPDALPALQAALSDSDPLTGMGAALALGHMGAAAKPVTAALVAKLRDPDVEERCHAAQAS
jgi:hypothetical protein